MASTGGLKETNDPRESSNFIRRLFLASSANKTLYIDPLSVHNKHYITLSTQDLHMGLIDTSDLAIPALATSPVTIRVSPSRTVPATRSLLVRVESVIIIVLQQWEGVVVAGGGLGMCMKPCVG